MHRVRVSHFEVMKLVYFSCLWNYITTSLKREARKSDWRNRNCIHHLFGLILKQAMFGKKLIMRLVKIIHFLCFMFWMRLPVAMFFFAGCWIFTWQCSTYPYCSLTKAKPTLQVTQDHSLGADLFFCFFFLSWESLFYSAMSCSASVGNYYCFCFIK